MNHYPWKRFWYRDGEEARLEDAGFLADPESEYAFIFGSNAVSLEQLSQVPCLILLGDPGMGKSTAVHDEVQRLQSKHDQVTERALVFDLALYGSEARLFDELRSTCEGQSPDNTRTVHLFLDSMDESPLRIEIVASVLSAVIGRVGTERLRFRLACRSNVWSHSLTRSFESHWQSDGNAVGVYHLAPLRRTDVVIAAQNHGVSSEDFLDAVSEVDAVPFAIKPVTLEFLIKQFQSTGRLSRQQSELYREGCTELCAEANRRRQGRLHFTKTQRLRVAARIAAAMLFSNRTLFWQHEDTTCRPAESITLDDIVGGTEESDTGSFDVTIESVLETLDTALFTASASGSSFAHKSYAEFLTADYLKSHCVTFNQASALLVHPLDPQGRVVPQLTGVVAWAAVLMPAYFDGMASRDPDALLSGALVELTEQQRGTLVAGLLELYQSQPERFDRWRGRQTLRGLSHPGLSVQLHPYIADAAKRFEARLFAIDLAMACDCTDIQQELLTVSLNDQDDSYLRATAIHALGQTGYEDHLRQLLPLLTQVQSDDDRMRAAILRVLWPKHISFSQLISYLPPPKSHVVGEYRTFVSAEATRTMSSDRLIEALMWIATNDHDGRHTFLGQLFGDIMRRGWLEFDDGAVRAAFAAAACAHIKRHEPLVADELGSKCVAEFDSNAAKRRTLAKTMLDLLNLEEVELLIWSTPPVIRQEDIPWLLTEVKATEGLETQRKWSMAVLVLNCQQLPIGQVLEDILLVSKTTNLFMQTLEPVLKPVLLDSEIAMKSREQLQKRKMLEAIRQEHLPESPPVEGVEQLLKAFEKGDFDAWWRLNREMTLRATSTRYGDELNTDLRSTPVWESAREDLKSKIVAAARSYVLGQSSNPEEWLGQQVFYRPDYAVYRAFRLLLNETPRLILELPSDVFARWAVVIVGITSPGQDAEKDYEELLQHAWQKSPEAVLKAASDILDAQIKTGHLSLPHDIEPILEDQLLELLFNTLTRNDLPPDGYELVLEQLLRHSYGRAFTQARSVVRDLHQHGDRQRAHIAARALIEHDGSAGWEVIWPTVERDTEFGRELFTTDHFGSMSSWTGLPSKLPIDMLPALYLWLQEHLPAAGRDDAFSIPSVLQNDILGFLKQKGADEACEAIEEIRRRRPDLLFLKRIAAEAHQERLMKVWPAPDPSTVIRLARHADLRIVQNANQLLGLVEESLARLQAKVNGSISLSKFLWNFSSRTKRPKSEEDVSDFVAAMLQEDLVGRGIVINREVRIQRRQRTDIHIDAIAEASAGAAYQQASVIVEVKGCWNAELRAAMKQQLVDRYLVTENFKHGIYLVAWFLCEAWTGDPRLAAARRNADIDVLRQYLNQQAVTLSSDGVHVKSFVLDLKL